MMKSETVEKLKQYGLTLFLTILCLCLMIFSLDLYPVGNKVLLWTAYLSFNWMVTVLLEPSSTKLTSPMT